jgi:hypothetical protein
MFLAGAATGRYFGATLSRYVRAHKRRVIRGLYDRGMSKRMVLELFRLIDWIGNPRPNWTRISRALLIRMKDPSWPRAIPARK